MKLMHGLVLCGALSLAPVAVMAQTAASTNADNSKSNFKGAGHDTGGAAKDTGHGVAQAVKAPFGKGSMHQSGQDFKGAGHNTVGATKDTGHGTAQGAKYTGKKTKQGAKKATHPDQPAPPAQ